MSKRVTRADEALAAVTDEEHRIAQHRDAVERASDPASSPEELADVYDEYYSERPDAPTDDDLEVAYALALHPSLPPTTMRALVTRFASQYRTNGKDRVSREVLPAALEANPTIPGNPDLHRALASDLIDTRPQALPLLLRRNVTAAAACATHPDSRIRRVAAMNVNAFDTATITTLANDPDMYVRAALARNTRAMAQHPDVHQQLRDDDYYWVRDAASSTDTTEAI